MPKGSSVYSSACSCEPNGPVRMTYAALFARSPNATSRHHAQHSNLPEMTFITGEQFRQGLVDAGLERRPLGPRAPQLDVRGGQLLGEYLVVEVFDLGADVAPGLRLQPCASISSSVATLQSPGTST